jgi:uncharacterized membrane protein YfcA
MESLWVLVTVFAATLVRSTFGFGESLVGLPLLLLFLPARTAVPLAVLWSVTIAAIVLVQDGRHVKFRSAAGLIATALPAVPLGIALLVVANNRLVKMLAGLLIAAYAAWSLFHRKSAATGPENRKMLVTCGFLSGLLGGAYGLNGPPLVVYGESRGWTPGDFRATLQAYFLPVSLAALAGYWYEGLWNAAVGHYFLISLPVLVPVIFLGRVLNRRIKSAAFFRYVWVGLILAGLLLVARSV